MKVVVASLLLLLTLQACAAESRSFEERLTAGNKAASSPEGKNYDASLSPAIGAAMRVCAPPGKSFIESLGKFSLVADVSEAGALSDVLVWPTVSLAKCFADALKKAGVPRPPYAPYPITIEMTVTP